MADFENIGHRLFPSLFDSIPFFKLRYVAYDEDIIIVLFISGRWCLLLSGHVTGHHYSIPYLTPDSSNHGNSK